MRSFLTWAPPYLVRVEKCSLARVLQADGSILRPNSTLKPTFTYSSDGGGSLRHQTSALHDEHDSLRRRRNLCSPGFFSIVECGSKTTMLARPERHGRRQCLVGECVYGSDKDGVDTKRNTMRMTSTLTEHQRARGIDVSLRWTLT